jgi:hypothetical protein
MLAHCKELLEYQNGMVAIHPRSNNFITALRTAVENGEGLLDKEATSHDDLFDSFRLALNKILVNIELSTGRRMIVIDL